MDGVRVGLVVEKEAFEMTPQLLSIARICVFINR
jgi:hypothetical protein